MAPPRVLVGAAFLLASSVVQQTEAQSSAPVGGYVDTPCQLSDLAGHNWTYARTEPIRLCFCLAGHRTEV